MDEDFITEGNNPKASWPKRVWRFYADGFRSMTIGRKLWALIIFKLVVLFLVLRLFFFPNLLQENYDNDADRAAAVRQSLTNQ